MNDKKIDTIKMVREIRDKIYEEIKNKTHKEIIDYFRIKAKRVNHENPNITTGKGTFG